MEHVGSPLRRQAARTSPGLSVHKTLASSAPCAANYDEARARALAWLGDRYLLATPINAGARPRVAQLGDR